jgi:hypothetical protein
MALVFGMLQSNVLGGVPWRGGLQPEKGIGPLAHVSPQAQCLCSLCVLSGFILMTDFCGFLFSLAHQYISHSGELWIQVPALAVIATCAS